MHVYICIIANLKKDNPIRFMQISVHAEKPHMGQFLQDGKKYFLKLHCDQMVRPIQLFSTVLKRFCPLNFKIFLENNNFFFWFSNFD